MFFVMDCTSKSAQDSFGCGHYSKGIVILYYQSMKRIIDIKTIQFVDPQPNFDHSPTNRHTIISEALTSHNTPNDSLRGSKLAKKFSQNSKRNLHKAPNPFERQPTRGKDRLSRSENGKRALSRGRERYNETLDEKLPKSASITRHNPRRDSQESQPDDPVRASFHITSQTRRRFVGSAKLPEERLKTEPSNCINIKSELMRRICKKINFMKKMTSQSEPAAPTSILQSTSSSPNKSLFRFDKFYQHCVKNINRCINIYEKDISKEKDKKYFQLKAEGDILAKELMGIRNELAQKQREGKEDHNLGVVGSGIEAKSFEKVHSHRVSCSHQKKKVKKINRNIEKDIKNPFRMDDMHGWEFGIDRSQDFYI